MKTLTEFYKDVVKVADINVEKDDRLTFGGYDVKIDNLPVVIPTEEKIKNLIRYEGNKPKPNWFLFNPLDESILKGENKSLVKLINILTGVVSNKLFNFIVNFLQGIVENEGKIDDMEIISFLDKLNNEIKTPVKQKIDTKTIENIVKLYENMIKENPLNKLVDFKIVKSGEIDGNKYVKVVNLHFPLMEKLKDYKKNTPIYGVKLRNKDIAVLKALFKWLFDLEDEDLYYGKPFGSNNKISPGFISAMKAYDYLYNKASGKFEKLKEFYDEKDIDDVFLKPLPVPVGDMMDFVELVKTKISEIPDVNRMVKLAEHGKTITTPNREETLNKLEEKVEKSDEEVVRILPNGRKVVVRKHTANTSTSRTLNREPIPSRTRYEREVPVRSSYEPPVERSTYHRSEYTRGDSLINRSLPRGGLDEWLGRDDRDRGWGSRPIPPAYETRSSGWDRGYDRTYSRGIGTNRDYDERPPRFPRGGREEIRSYNPRGYRDVWR